MNVFYVFIFFVGSWQTVGDAQGVVLHLGYNSEVGLILCYKPTLYFSTTFHRHILYFLLIHNSVAEPIN